MATTLLNVQTQSANFEDRVNRVIQIDPEETPLVSMIPKGEAKNVKHYWQKQELADPDGENAVTTGASVTFAATDYTARAEEYNYTQIPRRKISVDFTQDAVNKPGIGSGDKSEYKEQKRLKTIELKLDFEKIVLRNGDRVQPAPESGTAGKSRGVPYWITTNIVSATDKTYTGALLSQPMFNTAAKKAVDQGGKPGDVFCNSFQKLRINEFVARPTRDVSDDGKKLVDVVDIIESIAGPQKIHFDRWVSEDMVLMLEMKYWKMCWLRAPQSYEVGLTGSFTGGFVEAEFTVEALAEKSSAKITNLKYA